ncbi:MAG: ADP-ribosylglycohydrolase family protein [bacterium]
MNYNYPEMADLSELESKLREYSRLQYEYGASKDDIEKVINETYKKIAEMTEKIKSLPGDPELEKREPNSLKDIKRLRPSGPRNMWSEFNNDKYSEKLQGALRGRFAGCLLGAPVEFWSTENMKKWAEKIGDQFPPENYWSRIKNPEGIRYEVSKNKEYTRNKLAGVPVDDDITYTILGLLIMEDYGPGFSIEDIGQAWLKYLPYACTAEEVALKNLQAGLPARQAAEKENPFVQWIGADIRSDPWGYLAPGLPEKAAEMGYRDAYISHRRNGIYGEMYFSAVIAAAFAVEDTLTALQIGLSEIPENCLLAGDIRWALTESEDVSDYQDAISAVESRFDRMSPVHTNLNACLTIFGLLIGENDFTKVIGETVAMGYDNDCTAATAGSIFGAVHGINNIPEYWYKNFNNQVITYIKGKEDFAIDDLVKRFEVQAKNVFANLK